MSASEAVQVALLAALDGVISAPVFDGVPRSDAYPRVLFGETSSETEPGDCIAAEEHMVTLEVYSRDDGDRLPCKSICDEIKALLQDAVLDLDDPFAAATECEVSVASVKRWPDGITCEGEVVVTLIVEDTSG